MINALFNNELAQRKRHNVSISWIVIRLRFLRKNKCCMNTIFGISMSGDWTVKPNAWLLQKTFWTIPTESFLTREWDCANDFLFSESCWRYVQKTTDGTRQLCYLVFTQIEIDLWTNDSVPQLYTEDVICTFLQSTWNIMLLNIFNTWAWSIASTLTYNRDVRTFVYIMSSIEEHNVGSCFEPDNAKNWCCTTIYTVWIANPIFNFKICAAIFCS